MAGIFGVWMVLYVISMAVLWIGAVFFVVEGILIPLVGMILFAGAIYACLEFCSHWGKAHPAHILAAWCAVGLTTWVVVHCIVSYKTEFRLTKWLVFDGGPDWKRILARSFFEGGGTYVVVYCLLRGVLAAFTDSPSKATS